MSTTLNGRPTEDELHGRIVRHLGWRNTNEVAVLWHGYLSALLEWGLIDVNCHQRLVDLLPKGSGIKENAELLLDEPLSKEREDEINEFLSRS
jgi:hypothetical protein